MGTKAITAGLVAVFFGLLGCGRHEASSDNAGGTEIRGEGTRTAAHSFAFETGGARGESRIERALSEDGAEVLHGVTEVRLAGAAHPMVLRETATIDASGRLRLATSELRFGQRAEDLVRSVRIDAVTGTVTVRDSQEEKVILAAVDHAWAYTGLFADVAPEMGSATAVQAWVARRAAQAGAKVRVIDIGARKAFVTLSDQVLIADGTNALVILGDEAIETDADFVRSLPWKSLEAAAAAQRQSAFDCEPGPV